MERPDLVILDEPINALDESGAEQVRDILTEQKKEEQLLSWHVMMQRNWNSYLMRLFTLAKAK